MRQPWQEKEAADISEANQPQTSLEHMSREKLLALLTPEGKRIYSVELIKGNELRL